MIYILIFSLLHYNYQTKVRTTDIDKNGYVNNAKYVEYFQDARWNYFNQKGINYNNLKKDNTFLSVVNINVNYIKETKENDILTILTIPEYIGEKSFKLRQLIYCNKKLVTDARITIVTVDTITNKSKKIPIELIKILK